ncbi:hypothetical protein [Promicromonospora sukumoe]|uniref:hypothetical protein n=1 Tax=Promicromonospora sukumoe TaxID=88382 RepID=UPI00037DD692|nr:hypothetical protein [Promicromonospora sukumoe]
MFGQKKGRLNGARPTGVVIALGLAGVIGALGATPAIAADTEDPVQTAEVTPEATPEVAPEPSATDDVLIEVVPQTPDYTLPSCEGDEFIAPTMTLPADDEAIDYEWNDPEIGPPFDSVPLDVGVLATLKEGYTWAAELPAGWRVLNSGNAALFKVRFEDVPCAYEEPVVPKVPVVTGPECVDGELREPTITLPADGAITYTVREIEDHEPDWWYIVRARTTDGYRFAHWNFPEGWELTEPGIADYLVKFDDVSCEPETGGSAQPGAQQPDELAATGPGDAVVLGGAALLTVAAGVSLIIARRRVTGR